jgi:hypothetical protein
MDFAITTTQRRCIWHEEKTNEKSKLMRFAAGFGKGLSYLGKTLITSVAGVLGLKGFDTEFGPFLHIHGIELHWAILTVLSGLLCMGVAGMLGDCSNERDEDKE